MAHHRARQICRLIWGVLGLMVALGPVASARAAAPTLTPLVIWIPEQYHTGGAYTAIQAAPDGRIYLGTTVYGGFAHLLVLAAGGRDFQPIADMASATGERSLGGDAQAKIHTKPAVGPDGRVWFGTKSGERAAVAAQGSYPGGHLLSYDPQAGRVTDYGIPRPRQSIIAVGVDPQRYIVYALTDPEIHLIAFDPRTRTFADKGQLASGIPQPTRYLVVLANGDVYHPQGQDAIMRYQAASGRIERIPLQFSGRGSYEPPYALAASTDGSRFYGVGEDTGQVYTFMPGERTVAVQLHGAAVPEGVTPPGNHYTVTAAPDGNIYYTATYGRGSTLFILRLTRSGTPEVIGQVGVLPPPPQPVRRGGPGFRVQGSTAGPDGTLYVMLAYPLRILVFHRLAVPR